MSIRMDLHCHSVHSDGTLTPGQLIQMAVRAKIQILALTDHETISGLSEFTQAAQDKNILVLGAVELDTESPGELHLLGLDIDSENEQLMDTLLLMQKRRKKRNGVILDQLYQAGFDVYPFFRESQGNTTRLHIAKAICEAGYAQNVTQAFQQYLNPGKVAFYREKRLTPKEAIELIKGAGGIPTLAHPCQLRDNPIRIVQELHEMGLMGIEAYYPASTLGQTELFLSMAAQYKLIVTCGSDYHGLNREGTPLGCAWRNVPCLHDTAAFFMDRHGRI